MLMMQLTGVKDPIPVQKSFWQENVRHWKYSVGVWCCLMLGVITMANSKAPHADLPLATANISGALKLTPVQATARGVNPQVTLSYSTLDVTALNASSYGDIEF